MHCFFSLTIAICALRIVSCHFLAEGAVTQDSAVHGSIAGNRNDLDQEMQSEY